MTPTPTTQLATELAEHAGSTTTTQEDSHCSRATQEPPLAQAIYGPVRVTLAPSEIDGTLVVQIDTTDLYEDRNGPALRVYLNEATLFENPPFPGWDESVTRANPPGGLVK